MRSLVLAVGAALLLAAPVQARIVEEQSDLPVEVVDAYGKKIAQSPHGEDGHVLFTAAPAAWRPVVAEFLRKQGFDVKDTKYAKESAK